MLPEYLKPVTVYDAQKIVLIPFDSIKQMYQGIGPKEGNALHNALKSKKGFVY